MRFSDIQKGRRARKATKLRIGETEIPVDVRVLGPGDDIDIAAEALRRAKEKGASDPTPGTELYDYFERALVLLRACVDHDSPENAPAAFFVSVEQILESEDITRDHIAFLVEEQARFQDEASPRPRKMSTPDYIRMVAKCAEGDIGPFAESAPGLQWSFVRTMATQLLSSLTPKSPSSSASAAKPD